MRVAIVHDWLLGMRGGERILDFFCRIFPNAEIFTLFYEKGTLSPTIENRPIHTSFLQHLPGVKEKYRNYLPLFPIAIESFDLSGFDLIISSSHCVAKAIRKPRNAFHFCYCYTPMRYMWVFFDQYFGSYSPLKKAAVWLIGKDLKRWDLATVPRVDQFIAISETIRERIDAIYHRDSIVIYPPVEIDKFPFDPKRTPGDYYVCVSALVPYKRIDIIVEAFNILKDKKVVIVGDGNVRKELEKKKRSPNITFRGWVDHEEVARIYAGAKAFIFAAEEDFGIAPVEAQAAGLPVIAYGKGGTTETVVAINDTTRPAAVRGEPTGIFFYRQDAQALVDAITAFERDEKLFDPRALRRNALNFSEDKFITSIRRCVRERLGEKE